MVEEQGLEPDIDEEEIDEEEVNEEEVDEEGGKPEARRKRAAASKKKKAKKTPKSGVGPSEPSSIFYLHSLLLFGGRLLGGVLDFYNSLFDMSPADKAKIYRNISAHYAKKGMHEKALDYLKNWTRLEPSNPDTHYHLGIALAASGNAKSAIGAFEKVLKLKSDHKGAMFRKSRLQLKLKDYKGATEGLEQLLQLVPDNTQALYLLGIAYDRMDEIDKPSMPSKRRLPVIPGRSSTINTLDSFMSVRKITRKQPSVSPG